MKFPFSPASLPMLLVAGIFDDTYLAGVRGTLSVVLICFSSTARDGMHFFHVFFFHLDFFL
jgi:hypothetical protein